MPDHKGSKPLKNARWERYAQELAKGLTLTDAYKKAGYKTNRGNAVRLKANESIEARKQHILSQAAKRAEISIANVISELGLIGFANMDDYIKTTESGDAYIDLSQLTRDQAAAIGEVTVEDYVDGRGEAARDVKKMKFKLLDKRAALVDIGKHLGAFPASGINIHEEKVTTIIIQRFGDELDDLIDVTPAE